mmetsp:Transcript_42695/g.134517  ORF Transcript_42695/g.134517 Transcript_42695/m.134517 type:complete len:96 (-) Transcript_42695:432-719(-)
MSTHRPHVSSPQRASAQTRRYPPLAHREPSEGESREQEQEEQGTNTSRSSVQEEVARSLRRAYGIGIAEGEIKYISALDLRCGKMKVGARTVAAA